ncbi:hypothetical protein EJ06DRAFT_529303 [Trichodelitschia bisporula]|uniref:Uncharacterized protein n=1 Tax=Trichodelitschia bisporula TaxID=703511 RepID=A0A6G1HZI6_9PEZI|nr:hypothetical protein EJ06DRAFT_529303 [Trichodelitschia bisporula]
MAKWAVVGWKFLPPYWKTSSCPCLLAFEHAYFEVYRDFRHYALIIEIRMHLYTFCPARSLRMYCQDLQSRIDRLPRTCVYRNIACFLVSSTSSQPRQCRRNACKRSTWLVNPDLALPAERCDARFVMTKPAKKKRRTQLQPPQFSALRYAMLSSANDTRSLHHILQRSLASAQRLMNWFEAEVRNPEAGEGKLGRS